MITLSDNTSDDNTSFAMGSEFEGPLANLKADQARQSPQRPNKALTMEIAGAAIFSALSLAFGTIDLVIFRVPGWYIAWFDPISLIWILAFLIFGVRAGVITAVIGTIGLMPIDPTVWIGPLMKFLSTIWFIVVPYLVTRFRAKEVSSQTLEQPANYFGGALIAWLIRIGLMTLLNYLILKFMFFMLDDMTLGWLGMPDVSGLVAVVVTLVVINTVQSLFDTFIPYLIVFKTPIKETVHKIY